MCDINFWSKMALFQEAFSGKRFVCCALTILCSVHMHNTVRQSMVSIYDLGGIFTSALCDSMNMLLIQIVQ